MRYPAKQKNIYFFIIIFIFLCYPTYKEKMIYKLYKKIQENSNNKLDKNRLNDNKLDAHKTHHVRGLVLSGTLHIIVFISFLFNFHVHKHISLAKQSIPITITKLSDITTGPVLGPAGIIDETVQMAATDQDIVPIDPNKDEDKVENNQMANAAKPQENGSEKIGEDKIDEDIINIDDIEKSIKESTSAESKIDSNKTDSKIDSRIDELLNLEPVIKEKLKDKSKPDNQLGFTETKKTDKKKHADNAGKSKDKDKKSKDKKDGKGKNKDKGTKNKGKNDKAKEGSLNKFINDVLGSPDGRTTKYSGGAQALGELSASTLAVLREMIRPCWTIVNIPRANETNVRIEVDINQEGFVTNTKVLSPNWSDPVFKTIANSATRALADQRCQPFKLPIQQYDRWKKLIINFCPADF